MREKELEKNLKELKSVLQPSRGLLENTLGNLPVTKKDEQSLINLEWLAFGQWKIYAPIAVIVLMLVVGGLTVNFSGQSIDIFDLTVLEAEAYELELEIEDFEYEFEVEKEIVDIDFALEEE